MKKIQFTPKNIDFFENLSIFYGKRRILVFNQEKKKLSKSRWCSLNCLLNEDAKIFFQHPHRKTKFTI